MIELELRDIQSGVLRPRPTPFEAEYIALNITKCDAGRALMGQLSGIVSAAADARSRAADPDTWVSAALSFAGLQALGVPQASLDSFPLPFRQGMAARAASLGDVGESAPEHWESPLGSSDLHVILTAISREPASLRAAMSR